MRVTYFCSQIRRCHHRVPYADRSIEDNGEYEDSGIGGPTNGRKRPLPRTRQVFWFCLSVNFAIVEHDGGGGKATAIVLSVLISKIFVLACELSVTWPSTLDLNLFGNRISRRLFPHYLRCDGRCPWGSRVLGGCWRVTFRFRAHCFGLFSPSTWFEQRIYWKYWAARARPVRPKALPVAHLPRRLLLK